MLAVECQKLTESLFGRKLKEAVEARGKTLHELAMDARIGPPNVYRMASGKRKPSRVEAGDIDKIAAVEWLGVPKDALLAWAEYDLIGPEGIERIKKYAPEVLEGSKPTEPSVVRFEPQAGDNLDALRAKFPAGMKHPPTDKELKLLAKMGPKALEEADLMPHKSLWQSPPKERWGEIEDTYEAWKEDQEDAGHAAG